MTESEKGFMGTYFDRDAVLKFARLCQILAWVIAAIYAADVLVGLGAFGLQAARGFLGGMGFTDILQQLLFIVERPVHGILYFALLQTLGRGLLIALDVEANTRRAARK